MGHRSQSGCQRSFDSRGNSEFFSDLLAASPDSTATNSYTECLMHPECNFAVRSAQLKTCSNGRTSERN